MSLPVMITKHSFTDQEVFVHLKFQDFLEKFFEEKWSVCLPNLIFEVRQLRIRMR